jgi:hypothetical protein
LKAWILVLLGVEAGRQGVDDQGHQEHRQQAEAIAYDRADDRGDQWGFEREAQSADAEQLAADQAGQWRDRGEDADVADIQPLDRRRFGVDALPLGRGREQQAFDAADQIRRAGPGFDNSHAPSSGESWNVPRRGCLSAMAS